MKSILITGGAGFIGSNLAEYHISRNDRVFIIDNLITGSEENINNISKQITFINADLIGADLPHLLNNQIFDVIYHLASPASPKQYLRHPLETLLVNSDGTHNLLKYVKSVSPKSVFIYASTSEVYGDPLEHPQKETYWGNVNSIGTRSCYDEGKRFGEALCMIYVRQHNLDIRIVRIFNTYGPNMEKDDGRVISNFIVQALENKPITVYGDGSQTRSFCYISDMVNALLAMGKAEGVVGDVVNLGNDDEQKIIDLAQMVKKLSGSTSEIVFKALPDDDPKRRKPDLTKARSRLKWEAKTQLTDGLMETISYFKTRFNL